MLVVFVVADAAGGIAVVSVVVLDSAAAAVVSVAAVAVVVAVAVVCNCIFRGGGLKLDPFRTFVPGEKCF